MMIMIIIMIRIMMIIFQAESLVRGVEESAGDSRAGVEEELREVGHHQDDDCDAGDGDDYDDDHEHDDDD